VIGRVIVEFIRRVAAVLRLHSPAYPLTWQARLANPMPAEMVTADHSCAVDDAESSAVDTAESPAADADLFALSRATLRHYDAHAAAFRDGTWGHDVSQNIDALLAAIDAPAPCRILDFGCGPGRDLCAFIARGHAPVGLDGSKELAALARAAVANLGIGTGSGIGTGPGTGIATGPGNDTVTDTGSDTSTGPGTGGDTGTGIATSTGNDTATATTPTTEVWVQDFLALDLPAAHFDGVFANASLFHVPVRALARVLRELRAALKPGGVLFASNPRGDNSDGWSGSRYGVYHDWRAWRGFVLAAGFTEVRHYYRPPNKPRAQQPWLASVWRREG